MASIKVYNDTPDEYSKHYRSRKEGRDKRKKDIDGRRIVEPVPVSSEADVERKSEEEIEGNDQMAYDVGSDAGSMMSLSMDQSEREKLLMEVEEGTVSTVEDGVTMKGTSYYLKHQRMIELGSVTPLEEVCKKGSTPLSASVVANLHKMGMDTLFPVQAEVIPFILRGVVWGGDVCVCAPTGSGKTLAYVIPIIETLRSRVVRRLRALVLVPTHDLVVQVSNVFMRMAEGTDLVVEALYGNKGFEGEQKRLVQPNTGHLSGGSSLVDIVVSTPGRLVDHLQETPGFTTQHLQFLVIDEADRLLMHSFQDWLPKVLDAIHHSREGHLLCSNSSSSSFSTNFKEDLATVDPVTCRSAFLNVALMERQQAHLQKLLFSATLTQNPEKIDSLKLVNPQYFTATSAGKSFLYTIPSTLEQNLTVCTEQHKPLLLLYILTKFQNTQTLCFVGSIETAHRLTLLLKFLHAESFLNGHPIYEYSSSLSQQDRNQIIMKFKSGAPGVIICSDVMARGLDIQNVRAVVNYDVPFHVKTYVHRVGRTGRAGRAGTSWTIAMKEEVRRFKGSLSKAENSTQNYIPLPYDDIKQYFPRYKEALRQLHIEMEREKGAAATAKSLQHASFSLPLDSTNPTDVKSVFKSLRTQVATAWFPDEIDTFSASTAAIKPTSSVASDVIPSSNTSPTLSPKFSSLSKGNAKDASKPANKSPSTPVKLKRITPDNDATVKAKRRRRHKKNELESLSFSSDSDSDSSEVSSGVPSSPQKSKQIPQDAPSNKSNRNKNRKKRKRNQWESLSLTSTSSSDSEEDDEKHKQKRSKRAKDESKNKKKRRKE